jgi:hypothetical protein
MAYNLLTPNTGLFSARSTADPLTGALSNNAALANGITNVSVILADNDQSGDGGIGIDLGSVKIVSRLVFYDYFSVGTGIAATTDQCRIYKSNNNLNWILVQAFDPITRAGGGANLVGSITIDFSSSTSARYFKMMQPGPGTSFYTAAGNYLKWSEVEAYIDIVTEATTILSDSHIIPAFIADPYVFTYASPSESYVTPIINSTVFDIKLKHTCTHQFSGLTYKLTTCPRCLGTGYYYDVKFDALGRLIEVSLEDKLQQALEKLVLTERNDFHSEMAVNLKKWIGSTNIEAIRAIIQYDLIKGIASLQQNQASIANLSSRAVISFIESIEITQPDVDHLEYVVKIVTVSGDIYNLVGNISLNQ